MSETPTREDMRRLHAVIVSQAQEECEEYLLTTYKVHWLHDYYAEKNEA